MTKADLISKISNQTGIEKIAVQSTLESFMSVIIDSMEKGNNIYMRGFGSFVVKKRAQKTGRNISKNTTLIIPAHYVPTFKPAKNFIDGVKNKVNS
jgi:DNA-binding protein HU-beta